MPACQRHQININSPNFFGGRIRRRVAGSVYVYHGTATQPADRTEARLGQDLPGRRVSAVFRHVYLGTSPYIKAVSFVVRRCPNSLGLTDDAHT
jgi:hypothetical protein